MSASASKPAEPLTPVELHALIVQLLAGATGTKEANWRKLVGAVTKRPMTVDPRCNWTVEAGGSDEDRHAIERAVQVVREAHRWVC